MSSSLSKLSTSLTGGRRAVVFAAAVILVLAVLVRLRYVLLDQTFFWDELYHLLAARSWASEGTLRIADRAYPKAALFTVMVGSLFRVFGESVLVARLISVLAGAILVAAVFLWTRRAAGGLAAWIASLFLCFDSLSLYMSGQIRFYALHALLFWLGTIAFFAVLTRKASWGRVAALCAGGLAAFAVGLHLQLITLVGLTGLGLWAGLRLMSGAWRDPRRRLVLLVIPAFAALAVPIVLREMPLEQLLATYRWAPGWSLERADDFLYYHEWFLASYPTLWTLLPVAGLIAVARRPEAGSMCLLVFGVGLVLHSFAGAKATRYILYLMPFFFVLWGIALAELVPYLRRLASRAGASFLEVRGLRRVRGHVELAGLGLIALFVLLSNPAVVGSMVRLVRQDRPPGYGHWEAARDSLRSLMDEAAVLVTPNSLHALYYLGDYDFELRWTGVFESDTGEEFGMDYRTGRRVISTEQSLSLVMSCYPSGLFLTEARRWRNQMEGASDEVADFLLANGEPLDLPDAWDLLAFRWKSPGQGDRAECARLLGSGSDRGPSADASSPAS